MKLCSGTFFHGSFSLLMEYCPGFTAILESAVLGIQANIFPISVKPGPTDSKAMTGVRPVDGRNPVPSVAAIEAIGNSADVTIRNLRITQAYHALAVATADTVGPGANWCTFATWASKQAGQTIRGDDLGRKIEHVFADSDVVQLVVGRLRDLRHAVGRQLEVAAVLNALRETCAPLRIAARVGDAVARGNKKVFDEIGREFACFVGGVPANDRAALDEFCAALRPGEPPDGQRLLADAFRDYGHARTLADVKQRAERMFLANLRIGMHEQTRLQPEIAEALNGCVPDADAMSSRLIEILAPGPGPTASAGLRARARRTVIRTACDLVVARVRSRVRAVITAELMTLALPGGVLRLGRDLTGRFPESLRTIADGELIAFLGTVDPSANTPVGSGTRDWADLFDRMHFIADLFRLRHEDTTLFEPPFTADQVRAMTAGHLPEGDL